MATTAVVVETALASSASEGISHLFQLGPIVTLLIVVILGGILAVRWAVGRGTELFDAAIKQCEQREERAIQNWEKANERSQQSFEKAMGVMTDVQITLARMDAKMDK